MTVIHSKISEYGRIPPSDVEIEEVVLGAIMLEQDSLDLIIDTIKPDMFYKEDHSLIYSAILKLRAAGDKTIDILTVAAQLKEDGRLEEIGGAYAITMLTSRVSGALNIEYHAKIIHANYIKRKIISSAAEMYNRSFGEEENAYDLLDEFNSIVDSVNKDATIGTSKKTHEDILDESEHELRERIENFKSGKSNGVPTGLTHLDRMTNGWQPNNLVVMAARPSVGKTAMMLHFAKAAIKDGVVPCIYSLEMSAVRLMDRMIIGEAGIDADRFRAGDITTEELARYLRKKKEMKEWKMEIIDSCSTNIDSIRADIRLKKKKHGNIIVMLDYVNLVTISNDRGKQREAIVGEISRSCKGIARDMNIPFILLSQLNRNLEQRSGDKRPMVSDLRESGAIEQDSDVILLLYRPEVYGWTEDEEGNSLANMGQIIIGKNRDGAIGTVKFKHNGTMTSITDYETYTTPIQDRYIDFSQPNYDFYKQDYTPKKADEL